MTDTLKSLGQASPAAATLTALYTVPGATSAVSSSLVVCNTGTTAITFRLSHAKAGAADTAAQYLYWEVSVAPSDTFIATLGLTLAATDVIRCQASATGVAFNLYGTEIT